MRSLFKNIRLHRYRAFRIPVVKKLQLWIFGISSKFKSLPVLTLLLDKSFTGHFNLPTTALRTHNVIYTEALIHLKNKYVKLLITYVISYSLVETSYCLKTFERQFSRAQSGGRPCIGSNCVSTFSSLSCMRPNQAMKLSYAHTPLT